MRGFILKDILASKQTIQMYFFIYVICLVVSIQYDMGAYAVMYSGIITIFIPLNSMAVDEKSSWNRYAIAMPFSRSYLALSKYVLALLCLIGSGITLSIGRMISPLLQESITLEFCLGCFAVITLYVLIIIPMALKWGTDKARILILVVVYVPFFAIFALTEMGYHIDYIALIVNNRAFIPVILVALTAVSILTSIRICESKDY